MTIVGSLQEKKRRLKIGEKERLMNVICWLFVIGTERETIIKPLDDSLQNAGSNRNFSVKLITGRGDAFRVTENIILNIFESKIQLFYFYSQK